jgi:hypothetical protein
MSEFRLRLTAIEKEQDKIREDACKGRRAFDMFTAMDRDLADVQSAFHQQRTVLNAIGLTQAEHSAALRAQGKVLGALVIEVGSNGRTLAEHGRVLGEHTRVLGEHTKVLGEHTRVLGEHTKVLGEHTRVLGEHTIMLEEQGKMLCEQGTVLREHGGVLNEHGGILGEHTTMLRELKEQGTMMRDQLREVLERLPAAN